MANSLLLVGSALAFFSVAFAFAPFPLQDFCVAAPGSQANGGVPLPCKDPQQVKPDDFFSSGLHLPGNTTNPYGAAVTALTVDQLPGLNTLGLTLLRLDLAKNGYVPPHTHLRATELVTVLEGALEIGFVSSRPSYRLFSKVLQKGDSFVVPVGLLHYARNFADGNTVVMVAFNSQNPGIVAIPNAVFGATPDLNSDYLSAAFRLDKKIVEELLAKF